MKPSPQDRMLMHKKPNQKGVERRFREEREIGLKGNKAGDHWSLMTTTLVLGRNLSPKARYPKSAAPLF